MMTGAFLFVPHDGQEPYKVIAKSQHDPEMQGGELFPIEFVSDAPNIIYNAEPKQAEFNVPRFVCGRIQVLKGGIKINGYYQDDKRIEYPRIKGHRYDSIKIEKEDKQTVYLMRFEF